MQTKLEFFPTLDKNSVLISSIKYSMIYLISDGLRLGGVLLTANIWTASSGLLKRPVYIMRALTSRAEELLPSMQCTTQTFLLSLPKKSSIVAQVAYRFASGGALPLPGQLQSTTRPPSLILIFSIKFRYLLLMFGATLLGYKDVQKRCKPCRNPDVFPLEFLELPQLRSCRWFPALQPENSWRQFST